VSKITRAEREGFAALDAVYATLPPIACQQQCGIACHGGIVLTDLEARRLQIATHIKPRTTDERGRCVYLSADERCTVHPIRPLICRTWGLVKRLSCMHGCVPPVWLGDRSFLAAAVAVEQIGGGRVLRTTVDGLAQFESDKTFTELAAAAVLSPVDDGVIAREAERVRVLRALHGGRILVAKDHTDV
jgi:hypothetical protein